MQVSGRTAGDATAFRLVVATSRPAIVAFFESLAARGDLRVVVDQVELTVNALDGRASQVAEATAAVVDCGLEPLAAIEFCLELQRRWPALPLAALLCCARSVTPWNLRALLAAGVSSLFDLRTTPEEVVRLLETVADGGSVVHVQLLRAQRSILHDVLTGREPHGELQMRVLELVAQGLSDREIGHRLYLSPHTVKHRIEHLRGEFGVRNRVELAAWAGLAGLYRADGGPPAGRVPLGAAPGDL